jgi:enoyl-CoA hydratase/carnithine racemase
VDYTTLIYEKKDGVAIITLNRPEKRNAINWQMSHEIIEAANDAGQDGAVGAVILT